MTWQQPAALWLLLAVLLLLLVRRVIPRQRLHVATLHLWSGLETRQTTALSRRLSRYRLLLLHAGIIIVLVMALAQPHIALVSRDTVVILDVSMSMGAREGSTTRLEDAKARVLALIAAVPLATRVRVYLAGPTITDLGEFSSSRALADAVLQPVRATDGSADIATAVTQARTDTSGQVRIYIFSDAPVQEDAADVEWVSIGTRGQNAALTTFAPRVNADGTVTLLIAGRNFGAAPVRHDVLVSAGESIVARATLPLPASGTTSTVVTLPALTGALTARLAADDALSADNVRYAVMPPTTTLTAILIGRSYFVEQALAVLPGLTILPHDAPGAGSHEPDIVVCADCDEPPREYPRSAVLLIRPTDAGVGESAPLVVSEDDGPIGGLLAGAATSVAPINLHEPQAEDSIIARAGSRPVITAYATDARRIVEFRFDPLRSAAASAPVFPLLIAGVVEWLAPSTASSIEAGTPIRVRHNSGGPVAVIASDGRQVTYADAGGEIVVADTANAGTYRITADGRTHTVIVNPRAGMESNLSDGPTPTNRTPAPTTVGTDTGVALSNLLLMGAFGLLVVEWRARLSARVT